MRRLIVMRHAKSDWDAGAPDHERPLNRRGTEAAGRMGAFLTAAGQIPDLVLTSSATRAHTTAELAAAGGGWDAEIRVLADLYGTSPGGALGVIAAEAGDANRLLVVGHEPTWSNLVGVLTGGSVRMATATAAGIDVNLAWKRLEPGSGELAFLFPPRLLG